MSTSLCSLISRADFHWAIAFAYRPVSYHFDSTLPKISKFFEKMTFLDYLSTIWHYLEFKNEILGQFGDDFVAFGDFCAHFVHP